MNRRWLHSVGWGRQEGVVEGEGNRPLFDHATPDSSRLHLSPFFFDTFWLVWGLVGIICLLTSAIHNRVACRVIIWSTGLPDRCQSRWDSRSVAGGREREGEGSFVDCCVVYTHTATVNVNIVNMASIEKNATQLAPQPIVKIGHYTLGQTLGVGTFGKVKSKRYSVAIASGGTCPLMVSQWLAEDLEQHWHELPNYKINAILFNVAQLSTPSYEFTLVFLLLSNYACLPYTPLWS